MASKKLDIWQFFFLSRPKLILAERKHRIRLITCAAQCSMKYGFIEDAIDLYNEGWEKEIARFCHSNHAIVTSRFIPESKSRMTRHSKPFEHECLLVLQVLPVKEPDLFLPKQIADCLNQYYYKVANRLIIWPKISLLCLDTSPNRTFNRVKSSQKIPHYQKVCCDYTYFQKCNVETHTTSLHEREKPFKYELLK